MVSSLQPKYRAASLRVSNRGGIASVVGRRGCSWLPRFTRVPLDGVGIDCARRGRFNVAKEPALRSSQRRRDGLSFLGARLNPAPTDAAHPGFANPGPVGELALRGAGVEDRVSQGESHWLARA